MDTTAAGFTELVTSAAVVVPESKGGFVLKGAGQLIAYDRFGLAKGG